MQMKIVAPWVHVWQVVFRQHRVHFKRGLIALSELAWLAEEPGPSCMAG